MNYTSGDLVYEGKGKKIFRVKEDPALVWLEFKDSLTAFNAVKKGEFSGKGSLNRDIASLIFRYLKKQGLESHWVKDLGKTQMVCEKLTIIPLEVVVRNRLAGSTAKKFKLAEGTELPNGPLVEFFYKNDDLGDPFLSDDQALMMNAVNSEEDLRRLKILALDVNRELIPFFKAVGIELIDFKLEFGWTETGHIVLGDEITPDSCRLWDIKTGEKLDKDRFRWDLGKVEESYREVATRIFGYWGEKI